jgi:hypothetical protein
VDVAPVITATGFGATEDAVGAPIPEATGPLLSTGGIPVPAVEVELPEVPAVVLCSESPFDDAPHPAVSNAATIAA